MAKLYESLFRYAAHYEAVLRGAERLYSGGGESTRLGLELIDKNLIHVERGQAWVARHAGDSVPAAALCCLYPGSLASLYFIRQHPRQHERWRLAALDAARRLKDSAAEGEHLCALGVIYRDLGELGAALEAFDAALSVAQDIGSAHLESYTLVMQGTVHLTLGNTDKSIELTGQGLAIARAITYLTHLALNKGCRTWLIRLISSCNPPTGASSMLLPFLDAM
jgi:tetratricopeptide (TPR) repeat protein